MFDWFRYVRGREPVGSKEAAKERLRLVLVHDRADISPHLMEMLKEDMLAVISKYMEIDEDGFVVKLEHFDTSVALRADIPVRKLKRTATERK